MINISKYKKNNKKIIKILKTKFFTYLARQNLIEIMNV
ncbi:hypothetical protein ELI_2692 [Eubacterium callanderi]|uniref:Uncharacterized protein n=1 Tax=Eubacterium callanderi TaxID=53442 RepID=E3GP69_9FIRM|nr:hypothetical protein ELI_2692 [Eubacterium callanderi]